MADCIIYECLDGKIKGEDLGNVQLDHNDIPAIDDGLVFIYQGRCHYILW